LVVACFFFYLDFFPTKNQRVLNNSCHPDLNVKIQVDPTLRDTLPYLTRCSVQQQQGGEAAAADGGACVWVCERGCGGVLGEQ
jgi:hypothetical protein